MERIGTPLRSERRKICASCTRRASSGSVDARDGVEHRHDEAAELAVAIDVTARGDARRGVDQDETLEPGRAAEMTDELEVTRLKMLQSEAVSVLRFLRQRGVHELAHELECRSIVEQPACDESAEELHEIGRRRDERVAAG